MPFRKQGKNDQKEVHLNTFIAARAKKLRRLRSSADRGYGIVEGGMLMPPAFTTGFEPSYYHPIILSYPHRLVTLYLTN